MKVHGSWIFQVWKRRNSTVEKLTATWKSSEQRNSKEAATSQQQLTVQPLIINPIFHTSMHLQERWCQLHFLDIKGKGAKNEKEVSIFWQESNLAPTQTSQIKWFSLLKEAERSESPLNDMRILLQAEHF